MPEPKVISKPGETSAHKKIADRALATEQWGRYTRARDSGGHIEYVKNAIIYDNNYRGEQWDKDDIAKLDAEGKPALTINAILSTVNTAIGEQSSRRAEIRFKARRKATADDAEALNKLVEQITDSNHFDWKETEVFSDGIIQDRGYFDIRMSFDDNILGEVGIDAMDPLDVLLDPDAKAYDPKTWNEVFVTQWYSLDQIEAIYGKDKAEQLRTLGATSDMLGVDSVVFNTNRFGQDKPIDFYSYNNEADAKDIRRIRVIERQHKKLAMAWHFVDPTHGDTRVVPATWSEERMRLFADDMGLLLMRKMVSRVRWTVTADKVLLRDGWSPYKTFTIVPYFPYFRRGKPFGMVKNLISPQEQLNKVSSQELHVINTTANSGWTVEQDTLTNMTVADLEERGAETGIVIEHQRGTESPKKIQPNTIPTGLDRVSTKAANNIKEISGISDALLGMGASEISGVALQVRQQRGQVQMQVPLDNLARTRHMVAEKVLELVQQFYTEERVVRIIDYSDPEAQEQDLVINQRTTAGDIINNVTIGEYDIVITSQPARDTFNDTQFAEAMQLKQVGIAIPDDVVIEYSNLSGKKALAERIRRLTGTGEPTEEEIKQQGLIEDIQNAQMELEMKRLEAEIEEVQSKIALNMAKAQDMLNDDDSEELALKKLLAEMQMRRDELEGKIEIAGITAHSRRVEKAHSDQTAKEIAELKEEGAERGRREVGGKSDGDRVNA